jgi:hypothetical protein
MKRTRRLVAGVVVAVALAIQVLTGTVALAHNAGHIHLPNGECQDVGSGNHAANPDLQDRDPNQPGDQYGARWAAQQGNTPIWPRHCHEANAHNHP